MTFAILPFIVCLLIVLILWLVAEYVIKTWFSGQAQALPLMRLICAILIILCILHGLGVMPMPVTLR